MATILLSTIGTVGDLLPFIRLGRALKARGHAVTMFTHAGHEALVTAGGLPFVAIDTQAEFNQLIADGLTLNTPTGGVEAYRRNLLPKVHDNYQLFAAHARPGE